MANALLLALGKAKGKEASTEEASEPKVDTGADYKQLAKDALADSDWDAAVDALCSYLESE